MSVDVSVRAPEDTWSLSPVDLQSRTWEDFGLAPWVEPTYWRLRPLLAVAPLALGMAVYAVRFAELGSAMLRGYAMPAFDFGVFDQGVWLLSRFHDPFVTVMGRDLFGDHASFIYALLAPVYWVYPHGSALLAIQAVAVAAGAVPVYLVARHLGAGNTVATAVAWAYLLDPALQQGNLDGFHAECFLPFFFGMAIYAALAWKPGLLLAMVVLTLLLKENVGLLLVPLGLWTAWRRDRRWGLAIAAGGAAWSILMPLAVMPALLGYFSPADEGQMPFGGLAGLLHTLPPARMWAYLKAQGRPLYLWQMLFPTGFAFLRSPEVAAIALFVLVGNVLSPDPYVQQILYHYTLAPTAVLFVGTAFALAAVRSRRARIAAATGVLLCAGWASHLWGAMPFSRTPPVYAVNTPQDLADDQLVAMVPPEAVVSADTYFVPHVSHRVGCYLWPTPFDTGNYGSFTQDHQRLPAASQVQYLLLSLPQSAEELHVLESLRPSFHVVAIRGQAALFERDPPIPHN